MNYGYESYDSAFAGLLGGFTVILVILGIIILVWAIVTIVALWKVYKKAGKNGWEAIIPVYSYWVLVEIAGLEWWWFLLSISNSIVSLLDLENLTSITSLVSLFATFNIYYNIAKKFNKDNGTAVCAGLFSGIFVLIFGFSKNEIFNNSIPVSKNGIFGSPEAPNNNYNNQNNVVDHPVYNNTSNENTNNISKDIQSNTSNVNSSSTLEFSFCGNCGTKLNNGDLFCPNCGKKIK